MLVQPLTEFLQVAEGYLLGADGFNKWVRWDGIGPQGVVAGLDKPPNALALTSSGSGSITGDYYAFVRWVDDLGNVSDLSDVSPVLTVAGVSTITFHNVPVPADAKIKRRQILRNTAGQAATFYLDLDTTDLASTVLSSTRTDAVLGTQTAVPLLDAQGNPFANLHAPPPTHKACLAQQLGRVFATVERPYSEGSVQVANGSTTVQGIATAWTAKMAGRYLNVVGGTQAYLIDSVDAANQRLTLDTAYGQGTDKFALYTVRPAPAERKLVYYSEAGLPESWPATNALSVPEDGDDLTGLMAKDSWLFFLEKRHIWRLTFKTDPAADGQVYQSSNRGCVNNRCWVVVDDLAYLLDEQGIHAFDGGNSEPISTIVQELFRAGDSPYQVNWQAKDWFHAVHYPQQEVIRWFVAMSGGYLPRHAIAYNYRQKRWWLEEYAVPIGASCTGLLAGQPQVYLGSDNRRVLALWQGSLDGPDPAGGTVQGTVYQAGVDWFSDNTANFASSGLVGNPVVITGGTGKGQRNLVRAVGNGVVYCVWPWAVRLDATSTYQLGGVQWHFRGGRFPFSMPSEMVERRASIVFKPVVSPATMDFRVYADFDASPLPWNATYNSAEGDGIAMADGSADLVVDLTKGSGFVQQRFPGGREWFTEGNRFVSIELRGVSGQDRQTVYQVYLDGVNARGRV